MPYLDQLGLQTVGYRLQAALHRATPARCRRMSRRRSTSTVWLRVSVLSGNRNFEGRISPDVRANYLMSPPLVVAYALAGHIAHNFETDSLGKGKDGKPVYLRDIWPTQKEVADAVGSSIDSQMFEEQYSHVTEGDQNWRGLKFPEGKTYGWEPDSTYIRKAPIPRRHAGTAFSGRRYRRSACARCAWRLRDHRPHLAPAGSIKLNGPARQVPHRPRRQACGLQQLRFASRHTSEVM